MIFKPVSTGYPQKRGKQVVLPGIRREIIQTNVEFFPAQTGKGPDDTPHVSRQFCRVKYVHLFPQSVAPGKRGNAFLYEPLKPKRRRKRRL